MGIVWDRLMRKNKPIVYTTRETGLYIIEIYAIG